MVTVCFGEERFVIIFKAFQNCRGSRSYRWHWSEKYRFCRCRYKLLHWLRSRLNCTDRLSSRKLVAFSFLKTDLRFLIKARRGEVMNGQFFRRDFLCFLVTYGAMISSTALTFPVHSSNIRSGVRDVKI